jgi:signal transduction histidine kinase
MKFPSNSLRFRFLSSAFVWISLGLILAGLIVSILFRNNMAGQFHDEMQVHISELAGLTDVDSKGQPFIHRRVSDPRFLPPRSGFYWQIERPGFVPVKSPSLGTLALSSALSVETALRWDWVSGPTGRALEYGMLMPARDGGPPLRLSIASDKRLLDEIVANMDQTLVLALGLFALVMFGGGALQLAYGLHPLRKMTAAIGDIRAGRASHMLGEYPSEIQPLVGDLNALLEANAAIVARSRIQAGNLAHGLRTPLAILMDEADRLQASGNQESAAALTRECARMQRQIDFNLARARTAAATHTPGLAASLRATLEPIISAMKRLHLARGITFCCGAFPDVTVAADQVDLGEILSSLLDNAGKWAASRVMISWAVERDVVQILIDDDGAGLVPDMREQVFAVGERLDDITPGTGLGLAIARDLARLYGGDVALEDSPLGGLRARIALPTIL